MFSSATQPLRGPPRHNFVVSAITFEGFKLRSSNWTHALLIQISRTSSIIDIVVPSKMAASGHFVQKKNIKIRMDLKWPEMPSKVNFGHPKWQINQKWPEMQSKVIFGHPKWPPKKNSVSIWNDQTCYRKLISDIQNGRSIWNAQKCNQKWFSNI